MCEFQSKTYEVKTDSSDEPKSLDKQIIPEEVKVSIANTERNTVHKTRMLYKHKVLKD